MILGEKVGEELLSLGVFAEVADEEDAVGPVGEGLEVGLGGSAKAEGFGVAGKDKVRTLG